ncbi:flagellar biosynthetic protein FliO [Rhodocyclaceae bacterium SMB388]
MKAHSLPLHVALPGLLCTAALPVRASQEVPSLAASFGQMVFGLGVVIGLLLLSLWLIKRLSLPRGQAAGLKVLGGVAVGSRERVVMVEVGDKVLVLGVTAASVNTLHTLPAAEVVRTLAPVPGEVREGEFARWLRRSVDRRDQGA